MIRPPPQHTHTSWTPERNESLHPGGKEGGRRETRGKRGREAGREARGERDGRGEKKVWEKGEKSKG